MKKSLMLVGAVVISTFTFAQKDAADQDQKRHGNREENMKTVLSLDDKQLASVKEIDKKYGDKHAELRKAHEDLNNQREAEVAKVLTPEQMAKWKGYKQGRADARNGHGHHKRGGHHGHGH